RPTEGSAAMTTHPNGDAFTSTPLLTHEVGSLDKLGWRAKSVAGKKLEEKDLEEARSWGRRVGVEGYERLIELLQQSPLTREQKDEVKRWSSQYGLRMQESAGLDVVYDGEQQRTEMYQWAVAHSEGFEWRGSVRAFDNKYYSKAAVVAPISLKEPYHNEEFAFLKDVARAELKVPITGAYTIGDWSFDERYFSEHDLRVPHAERKAARKEARRQLIVDVARNMIRPNLEALIGLGARWIQLDEPGGSTEPPELVRDRILYAVEVFGDPGRIQVTPDCGLRTRSWDVAYRKLVNMVEGTRMAKKELGL